MHPNPRLTIGKSSFNVLWAVSDSFCSAHRIGQDKEVYVKRLVVEGTIEERYVSRLRDALFD